MAINNAIKSIKKTSTPKKVHDNWNVVNVSYLSTFRISNDTFIHYLQNRANNDLYIYKSNDVEHAKTNLKDSSHYYTGNTENENKVTVYFDSTLPFVKTTGSTNDLVSTAYISYFDEATQTFYGILDNRSTADSRGRHYVYLEDNVKGYVVIKSRPDEFNKFDVCGYLPLASWQAQDTPNPNLVRFNGKWYLFGRKRGASPSGNKDWDGGGDNPEVPYTATSTAANIAPYNRLWGDRRGIRVSYSTDFLNWTTINISTSNPYDPYDPIKYYGNGNDAYVETRVIENFYGSTTFKIDQHYLLIMDSFFQDRLNIVPRESENNTNDVYEAFKGTGEEYPTLWFWKQGQDYAYRIKDSNNSLIETIAPEGEDISNISVVYNGKTFYLHSNDDTIPGFKRKWFTPDTYEQGLTDPQGVPYYTKPEYGQLKITCIVDAGDKYLVYWGHRLDTHYRGVGRLETAEQTAEGYALGYVSSEALSSTYSNPVIGGVTRSYDAGEAHIGFVTAVTSSISTNYPEWGDNAQKPSFLYVTEIPKNRLASWKNNGANSYVDTKNITIPLESEVIQVNHIGDVNVDIWSNNQWVDVGTVTGDNLKAELSISAYKGQTTKFRFNLLNNNSELFAFNFGKNVEAPIPSSGLALVIPESGDIVPQQWTVYKWNAPVNAQDGVTIYTVGVEGVTNQNTHPENTRVRSSVDLGNYSTFLTSSSPASTADSFPITIADAIVSSDETQITFIQSAGVSQYKIQFCSDAGYTTPLSNQFGLNSDGEFIITNSPDVNNKYPKGNKVVDLTQFNFTPATYYWRIRVVVPSMPVGEQERNYTATGNFTIASSLIPAPTLLAPTSGATVSYSTGNMQFTHITNPTGVSSYGIQFATDSQFNNKIDVGGGVFEYNRTTGGGRLNLSTNIMTVTFGSMGAISNYIGQSLYWRVRVRIVDGITLLEEETTWSDGRQIILQS